MLRLMKAPERDTLPDFWGPMNPIGVLKSDSPRERAVDGFSQSGPQGKFTAPFLLPTAYCLLVATLGDVG
jgi:hypothetical protein